MKRLSIIIPVYNVEEYISRCLDSCINQDISQEDYEIIVVDDGSPDNSVEIVNSYKKKHSNIKLIHRENGGLSAARNTGLQVATGRYVWFVDSDDWIEKNCICANLKFAEQNSLDVLCFGAIKFTSEENKIRTNSATSKTMEVFDGEIFIVSAHPIPSAWSAFYRREFLIDNNLKFYEGILHEDQEFTPRAYALAKRISFVDNYIYYYYQRKGSIMKSCRNEKRCIDLLKVADSLFDFASRHLSENKEAYLAMIHKVNFCVSQSIAFYDTTFFDSKEYTCRPYYPLCLSGLDIKTKVKYAFVNMSIPLYLKLYILINKINKKYK